MTGPEFLTCHQAAELLGIAYGSVWRMARQGRIPPPVEIVPPARPGARRVRRWRRADLIGHLAGQTVAP